MVGRAAGREGGSEKGKSPVADFHWHPTLLVILIGRGGGKPGTDPGEAAPSVSLLAIVHSSSSTDICSIVLLLQPFWNTFTPLERCLLEGTWSCPLGLKFFFFSPGSTEFPRLLGEYLPWKEELKKGDWRGMLGGVYR